MPDPSPDLDPDFDAELRGLFEEAEQVIESRAAAARRVEARRPESPEMPGMTPASSPENARSHSPTEPPLVQMLRPLVQGMEALIRAAGDTGALLSKLDTRVHASVQTEGELIKMMAELRTALELKTGVNQRMFDALHEELRGYKDGFLLESVCRPVIRDLISLYDEQVELHRQVLLILSEHGAEKEAPLFGRVETLGANIGHNLEFILEVLARLEVLPMAVGCGELDKRSQRTVSVEWVEDAALDSMVARSVRMGFFWKERLFRAEEVVTFKCRANLSANSAETFESPCPPKIQGREF